MNYSEYWPAFFTATNLNWLPVLKEDKYKEIIVSSLNFLVKENRVKVNAFVIMDNHFHLIWQMKPGHKPDAVQRDFLKFTSQQIKFDLQKNNPLFLEQFRVDAKDRTYQIWERNPLSIDLYTSKVFDQKLDYLHNNPFVEGLCKYPEDYYYSSALFYEKGINKFEFLTHWVD